MLAQVTSKAEFIQEIKKMADQLHGRDHLCNFSWGRYGFGLNNYQGTPTSAMVDELINFEENVSEQVKWQAQIYYAD